MPLCYHCKSEAERSVPSPSLGPILYPPYGMGWGDTCSRCGLSAEVRIE